MVLTPSSILILVLVPLVGFLAGGDLWLFAAVRAVEGAATGLVYPAAFSLATDSGAMMFI